MYDYLSFEKLKGKKICVSFRSISTKQKSSPPFYTVSSFKSLTHGLIIVIIKVYKFELLTLKIFFGLFDLFLCEKYF